MPICRPRFVLALAALVPLACGSDSSGPDSRVPASLQMVSGNGQSATVGSDLAAPIAVKVLDKSGRPVPGASVSWDVVTGGGSVSPRSSTTDQEGQAQATWTLGTQAGQNTASASVSGVTAVTFTATATAGPPALFVKAGGDEQEGPVAAALPQPIRVRVADAYENPVSGIQVSWTVTAGGGSVGAGTTLTDGTGHASVSWMLGTTAGEVNGVTASAAGLPALSFSAASRPGPVANISLSQSSATLTAGETLQLHATLSDAYGNQVTDRSPAWSSSLPAVATVDGTGLVASLAPGPATITASLDNGSASADIVALAARAPSITGISVPTLRAGGTATLTGTDFSPAPGWNTVTVDGMPAAVQSATATQLVITVPAASAFACVPTRTVPVTVSVPDLADTTTHPLSIANTHTLAVGESVVLLDQGDVACNELDVTGGAYLMAVFNTSTAPNAISAFRVRGSGAATAAPIIAGTSARPLRGSTGSTRVAAGVDVGGPGVLPRDVARAMEIHDRIRSEDERLFARARASGLRAVAAAHTAVAEAPPNLGDVLPIRVPNINSESFCSNYVEIQARAVYVGSKAVILEDVAAPLAGTLGAYYQALGQEYDNRMAPILEQYFGNPLAVDAQLDNNGRIFMVYTKLVRDMGGPGLLGFVVGSNFLPRSSCAGSNVGEVYYATVPTTAAEVADWYWQAPAIMIHEVKHLTSIAERLARNASRLEDSWLEEASAQVAIELWARQVFGYSRGGNTGYAASVGCELTCADKPWAMFNHFAFLYSYYSNVHALTPLGRASPADGTYYGSAWLFLRWAIDHFSTSEAAFLTALTQETNAAGVANLEARTGKSFAEMLGLWSLSLLADDAGLPVRPELQHPSWNTRDIFQGLNAAIPSFFAQPAPLVGFIESFGDFVVDVPGVRGGGTAFVLLTGPQAARQLLQLQSPGGGAPPASLRIAILRVQ